MFCTNCGKSLKEGAAFCTGCGKEVKAAQKQPVDQPESTQKPVSEPDIMPEAEPVSSNTDTDRVYARGRENVSDRYNGNGSSYSVRENPSAQQHTTAQTQSTMPKRNGLAIGAFIVSFFLPILGLILGIVSMSKIKKTGQRGRGLAISSIVLGAVFAVTNTILIVVLLVPVVTCAREGSFDCWFCQIIYPHRTAVEYLDAQDQGELYAAIAEVRDMGFDLAITAHGDTIVYTYTYLELIYTDAFELDESGVSAQAELILSEMGDFGVQNPVVHFIFRNADGEILFQREYTSSPTIASVPTPTPTPTPAAMPESSQERAVGMMRIADGVMFINMRTGPSTTHEVLANLLPSTSVEVLEYRADGWSLVRYNDLTGFIRSNSLVADFSNWIIDNTLLIDMIDNGEIPAYVTALNLSNNDISDITPLAGLTNLTVLWLEDTEIRDITPLAELANLERLYLSDNNISDIRPLARLTNLRSLHLDSNNVSDIRSLAGLTDLRLLHLRDNNIGDITPLAGLTDLRQLNLWGNEIRDVTSLARLTNLTWLSLYDNEVGDITPLAGLTSLTTLGLGRNEIRDITPLAELTNLTVLWLNGNEISDITPLTGLTSLTTLGLGRNEIRDITSLAELTSLTDLGLDGNEVRDWSPVDHVETVFGRP